MRADERGQLMQAWYYFRGKLTPVAGEHPGVVAAIYKGRARVRFHEDTNTLAVQARSRQIVRAAIATYLDDPNNDYPESINAEWPGHYVECFVQDWK